MSAAITLFQHWRFYHTEVKEKTSMSIAKGEIKLLNTDTLLGKFKGLYRKHISCLTRWLTVD